MFKDLAYLVEKIRAADFLDEPFRHLYVENFFSDEDFKEITTAPQVALKPAQSDADLITMLHGNGFKEIEFPGTTTNLDAYLSWHKHRNSKRHLNIETCEGFGVTMRLKQYPPNSTLSRFNAFFNSPVWVSMLHEKFGLESAATKTDNGLQKYLDGYEISPHPDIRQKALTLHDQHQPFCFV